MHLGLQMRRNTAYVNQTDALALREQTLIGIAMTPGAKRLGCRLLGQWVALGQLVRIPSREPMPNRLFTHLILRHRRNHFVVNQQAINVQCFIAGRICRLEFNRLAAFRILDTGEQRCLEQFRFVLEFFHWRAGVRRI